MYSSHPTTGHVACIVSHFTLRLVQKEAAHWYSASQQQGSGGISMAGGVEAGAALLMFVWVLSHSSRTCRLIIDSKVLIGVNSSFSLCQLCD